MKRSKSEAYLELSQTSTMQLFHYAKKLGSKYAFADHVGKLQWLMTQNLENLDYPKRKFIWIINSIFSL